MDLIEDLNRMLIERGLDNRQAQEIAESLRERHAGQVYIPKRQRPLQQTISQLLRNNGCCGEIARKLGLSKRTVYRMMQKNRRNER